MFNRILQNTKKQISRSGWTAWASISVMTLAFLVASIFGGLAYVSNLYIQFIESKSNMLVFFAVGMDQQVIESLKTKWSINPKIKAIGYTTEEEAYQLYSEYTSVVQREMYAVLKVQESKKLPSSLEIQIYSLSDLGEIKNQVEADVALENKKLEIVDTSGATTETNAETPVSFAVPQTQPQIKYKYSQDPAEKPIELRVNDESLEQLRQVLYSLRIAGLTVLSLLFIVIFFFTLMTVEFRLYNQMEEIGVMQLVGGSLFFIRSPYILEGGFYGLMGSLASSLILGTVIVFVFVVNNTSATAVFLYKIFSKLPWPYVTALGWIGIVAILALFGFLIGAFSSYLSIRRYIR